MRPSILVRSCLYVCLLLSVACTTQEHHSALDDDLRNRVHLALRDTLTAMGTDPVEIRTHTLDWQTNLIANQARNADPLFELIGTDDISDADLRDVAIYVIDQLHKKAPDAKAPGLLTFLVEDKRPWNRGHRELTLGLINQLCADAELVLEDRETRRLLDHAVPENEGELQR